MGGLLHLLPELLLPWFQENKRALPWREDRDPYHVWLSEIMLQQTRVEAVKGYYSRFLEKYPTIVSLAQAQDAELMKLWEGLGYYSRARNLKKAAGIIMDRHQGLFPQDHAAILALPGIGDYTAGAICSICFDQKTPAVDGNVLRVVSRFTDDHSCTDDPKVKKELALSLKAVYPENAGDFTQALMELGAIVCLPNGAPLCSACPLRGHCLAKERGTIDELPRRAEKRRRRKEDKTVFLLSCNGKVALRKRPEEGLLAGLYEFPNLPGSMSTEEIIAAAEAWGLRPRFLEKMVGRKHIFTHIQWNMSGARLHCGSENDTFLWVTPEELHKNYALPTAFRQFVEDLGEENL